MTTKVSQQPSFEEALKRLELIISELERGELPLEIALARYEEGVNHLKYCHQTLESIENKIVLLSKQENGTMTEIPFSSSKTEKHK